MNDVKKDGELLLKPINVNENLEIEDYDHLYKEAVEIRDKYKGYIGNAKDCRKLKSRVNKLMRGLNNVRKNYVRPHRKRQKNFKSQIDTLIDIVGVIKKNMDKQLKVYKKAWQDKLRQKLQPDMDEICQSNGVERMSVPDQVVKKKSMSKKQRLDLMIGTVKKIADKRIIQNARLLRGKAVMINSNGEIKPLPDLTVKRMTFIGTQYQLYYLNAYMKKNGLNVKDDE